MVLYGAMSHRGFGLLVMHGHIKKKCYVHILNGHLRAIVQPLSLDQQRAFQENNFTAHTAGIV